MTVKDEEDRNYDTKGGKIMRKMWKKAENGIAAVKNRLEYVLIRRSLSGITVIELVLILVIIIALLLIFKNQLIDLINTIFDKITSESANI